MEMVGVMTSNGGYREQAIALFNDINAQTDVVAKIDSLKRLKDILLLKDTSLLQEFVPLLIDFKSDGAGPIRSLLAQILEEICSRHLEYMVSVVPAFLSLLQDDLAVVVRHAISSISNLFRNIFLKVAIQGMYTGHVEKCFEDSWTSVNTLKDAVFDIAIEGKNDAVKLVIIKFMEMVIFLFTPDPNGLPQPPEKKDWDGHTFNFAWLNGGHPVFDTGLLAHEAEKNLVYLLEQLQAPYFLKLPGPAAIVLVNSLASIAKRRPAVYARVLPAMIGVGPICEAIMGPQRASIVHAVKNALLNLLKCIHSSAGIWRERIVSALRSMNAGDVAEAAVRQTDRTIRNAERERAYRESRQAKEERSDHKRHLQENGNLSSDTDAAPGKRIRTSASVAPAGSVDVQGSGGHSVAFNQDSAVITPDNEASHLQQMIDIIGALVAKGERATASIELLITSLPPEMLADVVIENMKNLPPKSPALPSSVSSGLNSTALASNSAVLSSMTSFGRSQISTMQLSVPTTLDTSSPVQATAEHRRDPRRDPRRLDPRRVAVPVGISQSSSGALVKVEEPTASSATTITDNSSSISRNSAAALAVKDDMVFTSPNSEQTSSSEIGKANISQEDAVKTDYVDNEPATPAVEELHSPTTPNNLSVSLSIIAKTSVDPDPTDTDDHVNSPEPMDVTESIQLSPSKPDLTENTEAETSSSQTCQIAMPVMYLDVAQQQNLWKRILLRILDTYNAGPSGGNDLRFHLLARLVAQTDGDEEAVNIVQKYILADYLDRKGHELAMHILYQLYAEEISQENNPATVAFARTAYENFFISLAEGLRDNLPPTDKSLSKLFGEAPRIPELGLQLIESLCNPTITNREPPNNERITQGLSAVWILIMFRPPVREKCLQIALQCAAHDLDEVRTKAVRLVTNKLYALNYVAERIEEFATFMLHSIVQKDSSQGEKSMLFSDASIDKQSTEQGIQNKDENESCMEANSEKSSTNGVVLGDENQRALRNPLSVQEAQRCTSLYFALCTKKVLLLRQVFSIYEHAPKAVKQAAYRNMPALVRTIGSSSRELLSLISDPPIGSKNLLLLVLHLLTESAAPSPELIAAVKKLYEFKIKDARLLTPILSSLSKDEVLPIFPHLVALPSEDFKAALDRILQGSVHTGPALTPAEVLIAIHAIDPERDRIPLNMVKDACAVCFQQKTVFTQQVLAKVLNQLVEQTPVPMLFMRTVILAVGSFRSLVSFVMEILSRLISKQIWKWPNLWIGFLKCADQTQPHSFNVLLQLPAIQLEKAFHKHPNLRAPLAAYASKPNVRSSLPRSTLVVLGLAHDTLPSDASGPHQSLPDVSSTANVLKEPLEPTTKM